MTKNGEKVSFVRPSHVLISNGDQRVNSKRKGKDNGNDQIAGLLPDSASRALQNGEANKGNNCEAGGGTSSEAGGSEKGQVGRRATSGSRNGDTQNGDAYFPPVLANPGNIIHRKVGGGLMGHPLAHENEAPFPQSLADFFVQSFCPPGGIVCDPFAGSGTTLASAVTCGRRAIGCDLRQSQVDLAIKRITTPYAKKSKPKPKPTEDFPLFA